MTFETFAQTIAQTILSKTKLPMLTKTGLQRSGLFALTGLFLIPLWGCGDNQANLPQSQTGQPPAIVRNQSDNQTKQQSLQDGQYPLQQASYDDSAGDYTLMLLNTPAGMDATLQLSDLKMARLTDEQIKAGEKSYLKVEGGEPTLYLTEDFKIEYVHNVTEVRDNPQTGTKETVVVRRESSFWTPFLGSLAGNIAGQAIGNMLFRPQYYVPPLYRPGMGGLSGWGGYGDSYGRAVTVYRDRYSEPPIVERNRTNFRSTGQLGRNSRSGGSFGSIKRSTPNLSTGEQRRSTGSGYGSSNLRKTGKTYKAPSIGSPSRSRGSFGSGRSSGSRSGFGSGRRR
jgi:hypothetical protein